MLILPSQTRIMIWDETMRIEAYTIVAEMVSSFVSTDGTRNQMLFSVFSV